jgi:tRNA/tmRNA/rRNA uracil-C5-methylase (TrmA/RlmC/RlmD family)
VSKNFRKNNNLSPSVKTNKFQIGQEIEVTIDRLTYNGGRGVGRYEGFVFFISDTAPQEMIKAKITELHKNYGVARLIQVITPSKSRRQAPCPIATKCGGCTWQHITYSEQLVQKHQILTHQLKKYLPDGFVIPPIAPSSNEFHYRNRIQIHLQKTPIGGLEFGFFAKGTNQIIPTTDCLIAEKILLENIHSELSEFIKAPTKKVEIAINPEGQRTLKSLSESHNEFSQVNTAQNELLKKYIVSETLKSGFKSENKTEYIYDLYCGSGNLTFELAKSITETPITGVEFSQGSIEKAKKASAFANLEFISEDVYKFLARSKAKNNTIIIVDPPRAGLGKQTVDEIIRLRPTLVLYVSCDLSTLSRDLSYFGADLNEKTTQSSSNINYKVQSVLGIDMFPQTEYVETVASLALSK